MRNVDEYFIEPKVTPFQMDFLWAMGWRHFGAYFFRYSRVVSGDTVQHVMPLRVRLGDFKASTSQKRVARKNHDLRCVVRDAFVDGAKEEIFHRHKTRFTENIPDSIHSFLSSSPATIPCRTLEVCCFHEDRLIAASFLDLGERSTSSILSIYEPSEEKRSLGILLILKSIEFSIRHGKEYYYPGYAYLGPSHYDYKKRFGALEVYDWEEWRPLSE